MPFSRILYKIVDAITFSHSSDPQKKKVKDLDSQDDRAQELFFCRISRKPVQGAIDYLSKICGRREKWLLLSDDQDGKQYIRIDFLKDKIKLEKNTIKALNKESVKSAQTAIIDYLYNRLNLPNANEIEGALKEGNSDLLAQWISNVNDTYLILDNLRISKPKEGEPFVGGVEEYIQDIKKKLEEFLEKNFDKLNAYQAQHTQNSQLHTLIKILSRHKPYITLSIDHSEEDHSLAVVDKLDSSNSKSEEDVSIARVWKDAILSYDDREVFKLISDCESRGLDPKKYLLAVKDLIENEEEYSELNVELISRVINKFDAIHSIPYAEHGLNPIQILRICIVAEFCLQNLSTRPSEGKQGPQQENSLGALPSFLGKVSKTSEKGKFYLRRNKVTDLSRSLVIDTKADEVVILNKSKAPKSLLGSGTYKKVTSAIVVSQKAIEDAAQASLLAQANGIKIKDKEHEYKRLDEVEIKYACWFKKKPNLMSVRSIFKFQGDTQIKKTYFQDKAACDLATYIKDPKHKQSESVHLANSMKIMLGLAQGIHAMHHFNEHGIKNGLVHGDIKPGNILIFYNEQGGIEPRIADFGLTFEPGSRQGAERFSAYGTFVYSSPEILQSKSHNKDPELVKAEDIYALGVTLYELVIGTPPWLGHLKTYHNARKKKDIRNDESGVEALKIQEELVHDRMLLEVKKDVDKLSLREKLELVIYQLLDPDPSTRLTSGQFLEKMRIISSNFQT